MGLNEWDDRYLDVAEQVAKCSKDPSSKIGAVIVKNNRVVAVGFNDFPTGVKDYPERWENREIKYELVVHAEQNALIVAGTKSQGATIYVHGLPVCSRCAASIIQAGIKRVVGQRPETGVLSKRHNWDKNGEMALAMFKEANVVFDPSNRAVERDTERNKTDEQQIIIDGSHNANGQTSNGVDREHNGPEAT